MDFHKLVHHIGEAFQGGHGHLPLLAGFLGVIRNHNLETNEKVGDLGEAPGDNILPRNILISFCKHKELAR